jgi:hypothetical protein
MTVQNIMSRPHTFNLKGGKVLRLDAFKSAIVNDSEVSDELLSAEKMGMVVMMSDTIKSSLDSQRKTVLKKKGGVAE